MTSTIYEWVRRAFESMVLGSIACLTSVVNADQVISGDRWILLGDSIQATVVEQGWTPSADSLTAAIAQREAHVSIQNLSVPGAGVYRDWQGQRAKGDSLPSYRAKGIIITLGTNDYGTSQSPAKVYMYYKYLVYQARYAGLKVACVTPIWRRGEEKPKSSTGFPLSEYRRQIKGACLAAGGKVIDGAKAPVRSLAYFGDDNNVGLHLNTEGHRVFAAFLTAEMRKIGYWQ